MEQIDETGIKKWIRNPFNRNTKSIPAMDGGKVVGRIEYYFYGCLQDGYRMAYVDWVYVLPAYRHSGIAQQLFKEFERVVSRYILLTEGEQMRGICFLLP